jgi:hypothetical protein
MAGDREALDFKAHRGKISGRVQIPDLEFFDQTNVILGQRNSIKTESRRGELCSHTKIIASEFFAQIENGSRERSTNEKIPDSSFYDSDPDSRCDFGPCPWHESTSQFVWSQLYSP